MDVEVNVCLGCVHALGPIGGAGEPAVITDRGGLRVPPAVMWNPGGAEWKAAEAVRRWCVVFKDTLNCAVRSDSVTKLPSNSAAALQKVYFTQCGCDMNANGDSRCVGSTTTANMLKWMCYKVYGTISRDATHTFYKYKGPTLTTVVSLCQCVGLTWEQLRWSCWVLLPTQMIL